MPLSHPKIEKLLSTLPGLYRGPGGAIAVVQDGGTVSKRVWGYADLERRIRMTERTQMPICSISKHMVCLAMMDLARNPTATIKDNGGDFWKLLDAEMRNMLPQLFEDGKKGGDELKVQDLYNMQSGIRDYWAMTVLWGARAEDPFSVLHDAPKSLERTRSFHFEPGTEFSYSNVNFHVLARILEKVSGESLGQLLSQRVFAPAGMQTADLCANNIGLPLPVVGYEGSEQTGYVPAVNGIEWSGDAGVVASLDDMVAYEKYLDRTYSDTKSNYHAIAQPQTYRNDKPAAYAVGLFHQKIGGYHTLSHTGGLRGWRLRRIHVPDQHISVVILFNHETDSGAAGESVLKKVLGVPEDPSSTVSTTPANEWAGDFFHEETQRVISVVIDDKGNPEVKITYGPRAETLKLSEANAARSTAMKATIENDTLHLIREADNVDIKARRMAKPSAESTDQPDMSDITGQYHCTEAQSTFNCTELEGSLVYGSFDGYLGQGPVHLMRYVSEDSWLLACPRSMDAPAPGDWTAVFKKEGGRVVGVTIGCWLARKVEYVKKS